MPMCQLPCGMIAQPIGTLAYWQIGTLLNWQFIKINKYEEKRQEFFGYKYSMALAFATSIDAFILGIGFGLLRTNLITNMIVLFIVTSILVAYGLWVGYCMGNKYKKQIDICGGIILLTIGIKIICNYFNII